MTDDLRPFCLEIPQAELDYLNTRLDHTRWPDQLPGVGWEYGVPRDYLRELVHYWRYTYQWRATEARLDAWPQYLTEIDGATVHFAHLPSPEPEATPLLLMHGWPSSMIEFEEVAWRLTEPRSYGGDPATACHLVIPHIPGYALSGPTAEPGWHQRRVADAYAELMRRLGYRRYAVAGGDWGSVIAQQLAHRQGPGEVLGMYLTMLHGAGIEQEPDEETLAVLSTEDQRRAMKSWTQHQQWTAAETGYSALQATRPQTLAYALTDSPVGLAAWIAEKWRAWSQEAIDWDLLLDNIMLYWLTGTAGSSARLYYELAHSGIPPVPASNRRVPAAVAAFPRENFLPVRAYAEQMLEVVQWTDHPRGGHFPALEQPVRMVEDIQKFLPKIARRPHAVEADR
ncbi:epoxide hydrolase family protein [Streptomyces qinglanensis]|uniref:epoxide hydrolase family protein n=1 Tax=Streptomyces qinglanensis TaxID=943816 RepID=UPI003D70D3EA